MHDETVKFAFTFVTSAVVISM